MNIKDKYEISKQKLKNLEKRGLIKKESIKYEEENGTRLYEDIDWAKYDDKKHLQELASMAWMLRIGDVSRKSGPDAKTQAGLKLHVDRRFDNSATTADDEVAGVGFYTIDSEGKKSNELFQPTSSYEGLIDDINYAKVVHAGEQNIIDNKSLLFNYDTKTLEHHVYINEADSAKYCTAKAITERIGELASAKGTNSVLVVRFNNEFNITDNKVKAAYIDTIADYMNDKDINNVCVRYVDQKGIALWEK